MSTRTAEAEMTAEDVKDALRRRHPALEAYGVGAWTVLEEWANIDLVAFSAWRSATPPIVGYEVKVSRRDFRRELLRPGKRATAVEGCWAFWIATPAGLLTDEEKAWVEPEHFEDGSAFVREPCPARPSCGRVSVGFDEKALTPVELAARRRTGRMELTPVAFGDEACRLRDSWQGKRGELVDLSDPQVRAGLGARNTRRWRVCEACGGRGYLQKSVVEQEAPTLWCPRDVGLIEVEARADGSRCRVVRKAPVSEPTRQLSSIGQLVRWASYRPDPRHVEARRTQEASWGA